MKKYKVLRLKENGDVLPVPSYKEYNYVYKEYNYGKLDDVIGKQFIAYRFDEASIEYSNGLYATDVEGILYAINEYKDCRVFEVEVGGKSIEINQFKQRFERQKIIRLVPQSEVKKIIKEESKKLDYDLYHAIYPFDVRKVENPKITDEVIELLDEVIFIANSARYSAWRVVTHSVRRIVTDLVPLSVKHSVEDLVWDLVTHSVKLSLRRSTKFWGLIRHSVEVSEQAYIGSLFPNISKWKYIEHKKGEYPFQPYVDLMYLGFVPSFDEKVWRLHAGKNMEIVYEKEVKW